MRSTQTRRFGASVAWLPAILVLSFAATLQATDYLPRNDPKRLQVVVEDLARQLALPATVRVTIVESNALLVSVAPQEGPENAFVLSFEDSFLDGLDDEELCAVIAHELGHVWIFTHHPYLQTEDLANSIAFKVVTQDSLDRVYDKVRARNIVAGTLSAFMH